MFFSIHDVVDFHWNYLHYCRSWYLWHNSLQTSLWDIPSQIIQKKWNFTPPPQNFFSFWPLLDTSKLGRNTQFQILGCLGTLFFRPAKNGPRGLKTAIATCCEGGTLCHKILICRSNFDPITLKIAPGKFSRTRNPKITLRKAGEVIFCHFFNQTGDGTASAGTPKRTNLRGPRKYNSRGQRWNLLWFSESTKIDLSEYIYLSHWYFIPSSRNFSSKSANLWKF